MQERQLGDMVVIGSKFAQTHGYASFIGCRGMITTLLPGKIIIQITEVTSPFLRPYLKEHLFVHEVDCLPVVEDTPLEETLEADYPTEAVTIKPGALIEVTGTYAEAMDYTAAVGHLCMIEYVQPSFVHAMVLSGPLTGEVRDIHVTDIVKERTVEIQSSALMILNDDDQEFVYIPVSHQHDPDVKKKVTLQLNREKKKGSKWRVVRGDLSHTIGHYGYKMTHIDDLIHLQEDVQHPF